MMRPQPYSVHGHGDMISDPSRIAGYIPAMKHLVKPGHTVVDIGAGTGFFSLVACQLGARHVYAIEPDDIISLARQIASDCGYSDRITFVQDLSTDVVLPEPTDVLVSDIRGVLPLFQQHIPTIVDARQRLLKADGVLIPQQDRLFAALVSAPDLADGYRKPWLDNKFGLDLTRCHSMVCNSWSRVSLRPDNVLFEPQQLGATLDYRTIESPNFSGQVSWTSDHGSCADGLLIWFESDLGANCGYSNSPVEPELIYGQAFFPLERSLDLKRGDRVEVTVSANFVDDDYVWTWQTTTYRNSDTLASMQQSTFFGSPLSAKTLDLYKPGHVPTASEGIEIDRVVLSLIDGRTSVEDICRRLCEKFPARFRTWQDARGPVIDLLSRHHKQAT